MYATYGGTGRPSLSGRTRTLAIALTLFAAAGLTAAVVSSTGHRSVETTIPAGTRLEAALEHTVSTANSQVGDPVELKTRDSLEVARDRVIPPGVIIHGEVTRAKGGGRIAGAPELTLRFTRLEIDGHEYPIAADPFRLRGKNDLGKSAAEIGGGTVAGGIVGAVAGNTVAGALVGAAAGTGVAVATRGHQIVLPAGERLRIRLADPVTVRYAS
jgi:hypothetical protein